MPGRCLCNSRLQPVLPTAVSLKFKRRSRAACVGRVCGVCIDHTQFVALCSHTTLLCKRLRLKRRQCLSARCSCVAAPQDVARRRLVGALALCACAHAAAETHDDAADSMAKVLAGVTFLKELGNFQNAQHAMSVFGKVADAHISEARCAAPVATLPHHT